MSPLMDSVQHAHFHGSLFVSQAGKTRLDAGFGFADRTTRRPNTSDTLFQIASVSKSFAAGAILLLQEQGVLSVSDSLERWLPSCAEAWRPITIHQLLTHTSGIGHWTDFPAINLYQSIAITELLEIFQREPLKFAPGSDWAYSSPGYVLLAHLVEQLTREPYAQFIHQRILRPLIMSHSGIGNYSPYPEHHAVGYAGENIQMSNDLDTISMGAGDLWATASDLARWDHALLIPDQVLTADSLTLMFTPHVRVPDPVSGEEDTRYGYGWYMAELAGQQVCYHTGDNSGYRALNVLVPMKDITISLLANDENQELGKLCEIILSQVLEDREEQEPDYPL